MSTLNQENGRLDGWKAISDYLGWHERTVMRWEQQRGLPVHRVPGGHRHAVFAFRYELDGWLKCGHLDDNDLADSHEVPADPILRINPTAESPKRETTALGAISSIGPSSAPFWLWDNHQKVIWITACILLLAVAGYAVHSLTFPAKLQFTGTVQLTNDGAMKESPVSDGKTVYFGEFKDGRMVLAARG